MNAETSIGGPNIAFRDTLWTLFLHARAPEHRRQALDRLLMIYWKPIYFFIRRRGYSVEEAKDCTQEFFLNLLEKDVLAGVSRERGRFRTFLLASLGHFLANDSRRNRAIKRGGHVSIVSLDLARAEGELTAAPETPEEAFEREWALSLIARAVSRLRRECAAEGSATEFEALLPHLTRGLRHYDELARQLKCTRESVAKRMHALRSRLGDLLRGFVRETVADGDALVKEVRQFRKVL